MAYASVVLVVLAALFWGISGGIGGILVANGWDPFVVSFYRGLIGLVLVLAWLAVQPHKSGLHQARFWFWSALAGLGVAGNFSLYLVSVAEGGVAVASTLMYCAPIFVFLASLLLGLERLSLARLISTVLVLFGIALLTGIHDIESSSVTPLGVAAGLGAGLAYTGFIFGFKFAAPHGSAQASLSIAFAVVALILFWPGDSAQVFTVEHAPEWALFAALGLLGGGLSFMVYIIGLRNTAPALASLVAMIEPVTASLFGFAILDERLTGPQLVGMGVILMTVTAMSVYSSPARHRLDSSS